MNNNSFSGQIPPELSRLPMVVHLLLDNNNLSGYLPPEFSKIPSLLILQLDNNHFDGSKIPTYYGNLSTLVKLSLRNCSLQGAVPDLSTIPNLHYIIYFSVNLQITHSIPLSDAFHKCFVVYDTVDLLELHRLRDETLIKSLNVICSNLSNNNLNGSIPSNFSGFLHLQTLSLENNWLSGSIPSTIWQNMTFSATARLTLDFRNNSLSNISGALNSPANVTIRLQGNPVCTNADELNIVQFCGSVTGGDEILGSSTNSRGVCSMQSCPAEDFFEYVPESPVPCFCAAPLRVGYRLKSPSISDFPPYLNLFEVYITSALNMDFYQLSIDSFFWEEGPRLRMYLKLFPMFNNHSSIFNTSEIQRIRSIFTTWTLARNNLFGPYELLNFTLLGPYSNGMSSRLYLLKKKKIVSLQMIVESPKSGIGKGAFIGIVLGAIGCAVIISAVVAMLITRRHARFHTKSRKQLFIFYFPVVPRIPLKIEGVKDFNFDEMALATSNFSNSTQIGQGGYGKVYKGILADKTVVAIKRAQVGSLQGQKEFFTEIEFLSRLHHRNLVSLVGYCDEDGEQVSFFAFLDLWCFGFSCARFSYVIESPAKSWGLANCFESV
ncbi:hypothetical protein HHK36_015996 [Tetracentron sinense]|uniref:Protein kinase domain-containing protein n=1 Tax=Tetracentron sinense TaxID=13715 RepID=A0A834YWF3_TETSI|nr:hypothetical protein HHK36_015996 [Tetracentron sinense]